MESITYRIWSIVQHVLMQACSRGWQVAALEKFRQYCKLNVKLKNLPGLHQEGQRPLATIKRYTGGNPFGILVMAFLLSILTACGSGGGNSADESHTVSYQVDGTTTAEIQVAGSVQLTAPANPDKGTGYYFVGWFVADAGAGHMWDFAHDKVGSNIVLQAKFVQLSASNVIVDAYLTSARRTAYTFKTLQELAAANIGNGTTVNFTPGVYWTDDYTDTNDAGTTAHPGMVGISFTQSGLVFKGLTSNADDVRIAGNRGQTMGAQGNWNVIGVGTNFSAYNLTIANYCSVDLVFPRDPTQNLTRRTDARVQAQTITSAVSTVDKMYFENVRFVSFLNLVALSPTRAYFKNSYFQLTDDSIAGGAVNVFENCTFDFYGSHPSYSGSTTIAAFLHSTFNFYNDSSVFYFSKSGGNWVLIDNVFNRAKEEIHWENTQRPDIKHYVYNNTYADGTAVVFDPNYPAVTQTLTATSLQAFKIGNIYNVYNLLKGSDGWNPSAQQQTYDSPYVFSLTANVTTLASDNTANEVILTPAFTPTGAYTYSQLNFSYDTALFTQISSSDGSLHLKANLNSTGAVTNSVVSVTAPNGLVAQVTLHINPQTVASPVVSGTPSIKIDQNLAALQIVYDHPEYTDDSTITWYRGSTAGAKTVQVAVTTLDNPYKNYQLSAGDVGQYLTAVVTPKYQFSAAAASSIDVTTSRAITSADVASPNVISTDFANITWTDHTLNQADVWYADTYRPDDISASVIWTATGLAPWTYVVGDRDGANGITGLRTNTQGARLLYQPNGSYSDMALSLYLTPEKIAGQGFGSATDQYLEIYLKWDPVTRTGYALRFQRLSKDPLNNNVAIPSSGNSTRVSMIRYDNGTRSIYPNCYTESSVYMPGAHVVFKLTGGLLTADVTTTSAQTSTQMTYSLPAEIHFSTTVSDTSSTLGGFGTQFTGSISAGNRTELQSIVVNLTPR
jgi:hypothetical protein